MNSTTDEAELFVDFQCILLMLRSLITGEYEGLDKQQILQLRSNNANQPFSIAQVVFYGMKMILPFMTASLLQYPSISQSFIGLVMELFEYFPDKLKELDAEFLSSLTLTLKFGIQQPSAEISDNAFEAIRAIGMYSWIESIQKGPESQNYISNYLDELLKTLFQHILYQPFDSTLVSLASNAFFALVVSRKV